MTGTSPPRGAAPGVSVVIPAHDEAEAILGVLAAVTLALDGSGWADHEVIVVDDGSSDDTAARVAAAAIADPRRQLLRLARNFGHQAALRAGLEAARGAAIITLDGDGQHPPQDLPRLLAAWQGGAAVVRMARAQSAAGAAKRATSMGFMALYNRMVPHPVPPGVADFQLLDRAVVALMLRLNDPRPFLRGAVAWAGHQGVVLPYHEQPRRTGRPSYTPARSLALAWAAAVTEARWPARVLALGGLGVLAFGAAALLLWPWVVALILVLAGLQLLGLALVAALLREVLVRVRGVPPYVLRVTPKPDPAPGVRSTPPP